MVDQALEESQDGGLPTRVWRYATGRRGRRRDLAADQLLQPTRSTSSSAKVADEVDTDPVNATIEPTLGLARRASPAIDGITVDEARAARADRVARSSAPTTARSRVPVDEVKPEVTKAELAAQYPTYLTVDESTFTLRLWKDLKLAKTVHGRGRPAGLPDPDRPLLDREQAGRPGLERPELAPGPASSPARPSPAAPPRTRSRRAGWGSPTAPASTAPTRSARSAPPPRTAACGWRSPTSIELYDQVPVGTPIYIG